MTQLTNIAQSDAAGDESHRDEELRQAVSRAVLEGMITGYTMANGDNMETLDQHSQDGDTSAKRRRLNEQDGHDQL
jgi:hypothetical protein